MLKYQDHKLVVKDEVKFNEYVNWGKTKHNNKLDLNNNVVQAVFAVCSGKKKQSLYTQLRIFYWKNCDNIQEFENIISQRINSGVRSIEELVLIS